MRHRTKTESFGLLLTRQERETIRQYLRERRLSATDYLRDVAVKPLMELAAQAEVQDDAQD